MYESLIIRRKPKVVNQIHAWLVMMAVYDKMNKTVIAGPELSSSQGYVMGTREKVEAGIGAQKRPQLKLDSRVEDVG